MMPLTGRRDRIGAGRKRWSARSCDGGGTGKGSGLQPSLERKQRSMSKGETIQELEGQRPRMEVWDHQGLRGLKEGTLERA